MATPQSAASSPRSASRPSSLHPPVSADDVPLETLVEHLLAAKRALSSMDLVLRGNQLATEARHLYEESTILEAQTAFLRRGVSEQARLLMRVRKGMSRAYDAGRREFKAVIKTLDGANAKLERTMEMLRQTVVAAVFRPGGEEPRNLLDFVDENSVDEMRNSLKESIAELQAAQTSFDGDLLRFDTDLRTLNKITISAPPPPSSSRADSPDQQPMEYLVASLADRSHDMAEALSSLTRHFDLCVTAVRATEGGAAMARRKAAEGTTTSMGGDGHGHGHGGEEPVSISGVIADDGTDEEQPMTAQERDEMVQVLLQDAGQVDEVVGEITSECAAAEGEFAALQEQAGKARAAYAATRAALAALDDVGSRLPGYAAAEAEYLERRQHEKAAMADRLAQMDGLRDFYEGYASAYDTLILEAERRRSVDDRIQSVWRKARDAVAKLVEADRRERDVFRAEIGEFLPTDLWVGMTDPLPRWDLVPVHHHYEEDDDDDDAAGESTLGEQEISAGGGPALDKSLVAAARERLGRGGGGGAGAVSRA